MRFLIWYIRSCFCEHKWDYDEHQVYLEGTFRDKQGIKVSRTCKICGWHRSYWKF